MTGINYMGGSKNAHTKKSLHRQLDPTGTPGFQVRSSTTSSGISTTGKALQVGQSQKKKKRRRNVSVEEGRKVRKEGEREGIDLPWARSGASGEKREDMVGSPFLESMRMGGLDVEQALESRETLLADKNWLRVQPSLSVQQSPPKPSSKQPLRPPQGVPIFPSTVPPTRLPPINTKDKRTIPQSPSPPSTHPPVQSRSSHAQQPAQPNPTFISRLPPPTQSTRRSTSPRKSYVARRGRSPDPTDDDDGGSWHLTTTVGEERPLVVKISYEGRGDGMLESRKKRKRDFDPFEPDGERRDGKAREDDGGEKPMELCGDDSDFEVLSFSSQPVPTIDSTRSTAATTSTIVAASRSDSDPIIDDFSQPHLPSSFSNIAEPRSSLHSSSSSSSSPDLIITPLYASNSPTPRSPTPLPPENPSPAYSYYHSLSSSLSYSLPLPSTFLQPKVVNYTGPLSVTRFQRTKLEEECGMLFELFENMDVEEIDEEEERREREGRCWVSDRMGVGCKGLRREECGVLERRFWEAGVSVEPESEDEEEYRRWPKIERRRGKKTKTVEPPTLQPTPSQAPPSHLITPPHSPPPLSTHTAPQTLTAIHALTSSPPTEITPPFMEDIKLALPSLGEEEQESPPRPKKGSGRKAPIGLRGLDRGGGGANVDFFC